jgi:hypothetical protein
MTTSRDMRDQITTACDASEGQYDIDAILTDLQTAHGTVNIDAIPADDFWTTVLAHAEV